MNRIKYYARVLSGMSLERVKYCLDFCHERSGKSRFVLFFDMIWCGLRYGAGWNDYRLFGFDGLTAAQRDTYVTRVRNKRIITRLNQEEEYGYIFDCKNVFAEYFGEYMRRGLLDMRGITKEKLAEFVKGKDAFFAKPNNGSSGIGIEKLRPADFESIDALYDYLRDPAKKFGLLEEAIVQHPACAALYPDSVNSMRIVSLVDDAGTPHIIYTIFKMGDHGRFVDNLDIGGMCIPVDPKTGKLVGLAHTGLQKTVDRHPSTGIVFDGYQIPYVKEAHELVKKAALVVPQMRFLGWDICIMPDGPAVIECNNYPGHDFWQLPEHTPDKTGLMPLYKKLLPGYH